MRAPVDPEAERERRLASARKRRYRRNQKNGLDIALTPYSDEITKLLLDLGWLPVAKSEDPRAVGRAIFAMLDDTAKHHRGETP